MTTGVEAATRDLESCNESMELVSDITEIETLRNKSSNAQIEVEIDREEEQPPDNQVNPAKSEDNIVMFSKQLERFMESVREGFEKLRSEMHSNNAKLTENLNAKIQAENSRLVEHIENNKKVIRDFEKRV
jgi:hypothetical protein